MRNLLNLRNNNIVSLASRHSGVWNLTRRVISPRPRMPSTTRRGKIASENVRRGGPPSARRVAGSLRSDKPDWATHFKRVCFSVNYFPRAQNAQKPRHVHLDGVIISSCYKSHERFAIDKYGYLLHAKCTRSTVAEHPVAHRIIRYYILLLYSRMHASSIIRLVVSHARTLIGFSSQGGKKITSYYRAAAHSNSRHPSKRWRASRRGFTFFRPSHRTI